MMFKDRVEAGQQLAEALKNYSHKTDVVVLGLPRGGVVTAAVIAKALQAPLDIIITRKLGAPGNKEYALGALSEEGEVLGSGSAEVIWEEKTELTRRIQLYRHGQAMIELSNKIVIIVDDGIATGLTMHAAIASVKHHRPKQIIVAVPIAPPDTIAELKKMVDDVVVLDQPESFMAVGQFYEEFDQVNDSEVQSYLQNHD